MLPSSDLPLFNLPAGEALRDEGHAKALAGAVTWSERCVAEIERRVREGSPFTADDVVLMVGLPDGVPGSNKNNAVGAIMRVMAKRKVITRTGRVVQSKRKASRARLLSEWVGVR
jgi:hypothetical protein